MANLLRDMEIVELRDGMVICAWTSPTAPIGGAGFQGAAQPLGSYRAQTPVLLAELTDGHGQPVPPPKKGDHVQDMDDGTRVHVPRP